MNTCKFLILSAAISASCAASAQDTGRVISSQPIVQQVAVPRQVCSAQQVAVQQQKSGAGAFMGALAGGAMGNAVGRGSGNAAATMLGIVGGAIVGDRIEGAPAPQVQTVQNCATQNFMENRTVGYNVTYEFAGKQYSVQMPQDPGPTIQLSVTPVGAQSQGQNYQGNVVTSPPVYQQAPAIVQYQPVYQPYYTQPYYPPIGLNLDFGFWGGGRHWR
jgi:uncharacterized protein YcfJ